MYALLNVVCLCKAALLWSSLGSSLLIHSHSDVDSSNNSYYGATGLYIMRYLH